jgi:hypothetical protein
MATDEEIRAAFHDRFGTALNDLSVDPALLSTLRQRHTRQQRLMLLGAPVGVAVLTVGSIVAAGSLGGSSSSGPSATLRTSRTPTPTPPATGPAAGPTADLLGHRISLPSGWVTKGAGRVIDLNTVQPPQPVDGKDQSLDARSSDGSQSIEVTVYRGPIAAGEAKVAPAAPDELRNATIDGHPASVDAFGTSPDCTYSPFSSPFAAESNSKARKLLKAHHGLLAGLGSQGRRLLLGRCSKGPSMVVGEAGAITTGITFSATDFVVVQSNGLTTHQVESLLEAALSD